MRPYLIAAAAVVCALAGLVVLAAVIGGAR